MLNRRGALHGIAGRLALLENRVAASRVIPLAVAGHGGLTALPGGRKFATMADMMEATGQDVAPMVISGPEVAQYDR